MRITSVTSKGQVTIPRQCEAARRLIESGGPLRFARAVLLELENGCCAGTMASGRRRRFPCCGTCSRSHTLSIEDRASIEQALSQCDAEIDFADALHHASCRGSKSIASFDERRFARRARKLRLAPGVSVLV